MQASTRRRQLRAASNYRVPRGNAPAMADPPESCRPTGIRPAVRPTTRPRCFPSHRWFQRQLNTRLSRRRCSGGREGKSPTYSYSPGPIRCRTRSPFSLPLPPCVFLVSSHLSYLSSEFRGGIVSLSLYFSPLLEGNGDLARSAIKNKRGACAGKIKILSRPKRRV